MWLRTQREEKEGQVGKAAWPQGGCSLACVLGEVRADRAAGCPWLGARGDKLQPLHTPVEGHWGHQMSLRQTGVAALSGGEGPALQRDRRSREEPGC